jgi:aminoacyl tRNA synthase complex-interacting multifunctional protein 1
MMCYFGDFQRFSELLVLWHDAKDSTAAKPVFNRVVTLRDSWAPAAASPPKRAGADAGAASGRQAAPAAGPGAAAAAGRAADSKYPYSSLPPSAQAKVGDWPRAELRVGVVLACRAHPDADSLLVSAVACGDAEGPRTVVSGLAKFVAAPADLVGLTVVVAANLAPATVRGVASEGMLLAAARRGSGGGDADVVELVLAPAGSVVGERLVLEAAPGDADVIKGDDVSKLPDAVLKSEGQVKCWKRVVGLLAANGDGDACFDGRRIVSSAGACRAPTLRNAPIS